MMIFAVAEEGRKGEPMDLIERHVAINAVDAIGHIATMPDGDKCIRRSAVKYTLSMLPSAQTVATDTNVGDKISRQAAIDVVNSIDNLDAKAQGGICIALMGLPLAQPEQRWIPVSEMCPKKNGYYLTTTIYKQVHRDYWIDDRFDRTETVIAWMPLPEPYLECNEERRTDGDQS